MPSFDSDGGVGTTLNAELFIIILKVYSESLSFVRVESTATTLGDLN